MPESRTTGFAYPEGVRVSEPEGLVSVREVKETVKRSIVWVSDEGYMAMFARGPVNLAVSMPPNRREPERASVGIVSITPEMLFEGFWVLTKVIEPETVCLSSNNALINH